MTRTTGLRPARIRARIKGTRLYVDTGRPAVAAWQTTGDGPRARRWQPGPIGPNAAADQGLAQLREQTRELVRRNAIAGTAIDRLVDNVVGTGIKPQLRGDLQTLWLRWTDEADAAGQVDFYGLQAQAYRAVAEAGECFVLLRSDPGGSVPLTLQVVEAEQCPLHLTRSDGTLIRQGIELDPQNPSRRLAYWIYPRHPGDGAALMGGAGGMEPVRVPADQVLHLYWPTRPGQLRGEPVLSRVLDLIADVADYNRAELVRKRTAAMLVGFVRRNLPEGYTPTDLKEVWGAATFDDGGAGQAHVDMEPGTMQVLAPGEEVTFAEPKDVGGQYDVFMRQLLRLIAGGAGVLYEQLSGDFSHINDRTWRAAVNEFRRHCEMLQHHLMVYQLCRPVWRRFALLAQALGAAPPGLDPQAPVKWTPQAWPYIHPVQDVEAKREEVRSGFASRAGVVSERGEDAEAIDAEIAEDNARADRLGLVHDSDGRFPRGGGKPAAVKADTPNSQNNGGTENADPD